LAATDAVALRKTWVRWSERLFGDGAVAHELLGTLEIVLGKPRLALGLRQRPTRLIRRRSETAACRW